MLGGENDQVIFYDETPERNTTVGRGARMCKQVIKAVVEWNNDSSDVVSTCQYWCKMQHYNCAAASGSMY